ncbi:MAG: mechanosensitive ion channel [Candidatus Hydrogenedentes bacterium]|nr:mechanosensitive ion channel [Candidatus Hydrogenedentota bacterium]
MNRHCWKTLSARGSWFRKLGCVLGVLALLCAFPVVYGATEPAPAAAPKDATPAPPAPAAPAAPKVDLTTELKQKLKDLAPKISEAEKAATPELAQQIGIPPEQVIEKTQRLRDLKDLYDRQIATLAQISTTEKALTDLKSGAGSKPDEKPVKTIGDLDELANALDAQKLEADANTPNAANAKNAVDAARQQVDAARKALADSQQALDANQDAAAAAGLQWRHDLAQIAVPLAEGTVALRELEAELAAKDAELSQTKTGFLDTAYQKARKTALFTKTEFNSKLENIEKQRSEIKAERQDQLKNLALNTARATDAHSDVSKGAEGGGDAAMQHKMAVMSLRDAAEQTSKVSAELLLLFVGETGAEGYLDIESDLWKVRFDVWTGQAATRLEADKDHVDKRIETISQKRSTLDSRVQVLRRQINDQRKKIDEWKEEDGDKNLAQKELDALSDRARVYYRSIAYLDSLNRMGRRILDEIATRRNTLSFSERVATFGDKAQKIWNKGYENPATKTTLTVGQVISAIVLLLVGVLVSRRITRAMRRILLSRARVDENAAATFERILYYALIVLVVLAAMNVVNIPLTVFTFFGGAVAIGVGFGAQNIVNNFISGLILMVERPIKINDIVEVDGHRGRIMSIGARCSQLRLNTGIDILVPNSHFLERHVINSTLTDTHLQCSVKVGVAYGSAAREVSRLLQKATEEHGKILKSPEPMVLFSDFGDSALVFELLFWVDLTGLSDPRIVCSDIRFIIDRLFAEAGVTMAYPQRDVHVDTRRPLDIRVISQADAQVNDDAAQT